MNLARVEIDDQAYLLLGTDLDAIGALRLGLLVRLAVVAPGANGNLRVVEVISDSIWSRHPDTPADAGDNGDAIRLLCEGWLGRHGGKLPPSALFAIRIVRQRS